MGKKYSDKPLFYDLLKDSYDIEYKQGDESKSIDEIKQKRAICKTIGNAELDFLAVILAVVALGINAISAGCNNKSQVIIIVIALSLILTFISYRWCIKCAVRAEALNDILEESKGRQQYAVEETGQEYTVEVNGQEYTVCLRKKGEN